MPDHDLRRNPDNEPVCVCGYRPAVLDDGFRPWVGRVKAQTAVLDHAKAMNEDEARKALIGLPMSVDAATRFAEGVLGVWQKKLLQRSPDAPFVVPDARYPRAGVRQMADGRWKLMGWDREDVAHRITDAPWFDDRAEACEVGRIIIGAHRQSGTDLNGLGR